MSEPYDVCFSDTLTVRGPDRDVPEVSGARPEDAMTDAAEWVRMTAANGQAVSVAYPLALSGASRLPRELRSTRDHRHHALEDALEQAEIFATIIDWNGDRGA